MKHRRIDIFGHQTSLCLESEYWGWLYEIASKTGETLKGIIERIASHRDYKRSLASEIRVAVAAHFHGNPYPICRCPADMVPMRNGDVLLGWPGGRRRAQDGPHVMLVDQKHGTRRPRSQQRGISDSGRPPRPRAA